MYMEYKLIIFYRLTNVLCHIYIYMCVCSTKLKTAYYETSHVTLIHLSFNVSQCVQVPTILIILRNPLSGKTKHCFLLFLSSQVLESHWTLRP